MLTTSPGLIFAVFKCVISMSWKNADVLIESVQYVLNLQSTSVFVIQFVQKEIYFLRTETMLKKTSTNILLGFT